MSIPFANFLLFGTAALALLLLGINVIGMRTGPAAEDGRDALLARTVDQLLAPLPPDAPAAPAEFCSGLTDALSRRFPHGYARHTVWSNYACRLAGLLVPRLAEIHTTPALLRYGRAALCSQTAQAFVDAASRAGLPARVVALDGHVVAEAYYENRWHGFDPDYGVVFRLGDGPVLSVAELIGSPQRTRAVYAHHRLPRGNAEVLEVFARGSPTYLPAGAHAVPRLAAVQRILAALKWLLPLCLLLLCWLLR